MLFLARCMLRWHFDHIVLHPGIFGRESLDSLTVNHWLIIPSQMEVAPHPSTVDATQKRRRFKNTKETEKKIHKGRIVRRRTSGGHRPSPLNMNHVHPFTHTRSHFVCHGLPLTDWLYSNEQWSPIGPHVVLKWSPIGPHHVVLSVSYLISLKRLLFKNIALDGFFSALYMAVPVMYASGLDWVWKSL